MVDPDSMKRLTRRIAEFSCFHWSASVVEAVVVDVLSSSFSTTREFAVAADGIRFHFLDANGQSAHKMRQIWLGW